MAIADIAMRQRGVVSVAQLRAVGVGRGAIAHRVASGRLHRVHKGVYLVGHAAAAPRARETAALIACGTDAVLSHRSAGAIWGLTRPWPGPVDVTVGRDCGRRAGIRLHRVGVLDRRDIRHREGLVVTAPARTLIDLASVLNESDTERALNEALVLKLTGEPDLHAAVLRSHGRPGTATLRSILHRREPGFTRSEAERRLRALLRGGGVDPPQTNTRIGPYEVDMAWRSARLVVEVDGWAFHSTRAAFERDRARDADLQARGFQVLRFT
jgi:hypothetical protein